jgi:hypothetical protein
MILVAAAAAGFGAVRGWMALRSAFPQIDSGPLPPHLAGFHDWYTATRLVLLSLTLALIPLGLRRSSTSMRRQWARPGTVVPAAVSLSVLACLIDQHAFPFAVGFLYLYASAAQRIFSIVTEAVEVARAATAIGIAWSTLALAGCREPEDDWVGRLGRVLGFVWIGACLGFRAYELVIYRAFGRVVV